MEGGPNIQEAIDNSDTSSETSDFEETSGYVYSCCHPRGGMHRFLALFFMCWLGFGSYFCYDNPSALQDYFTRDLNITTTQFSLFYSLYSWPTVIVCVIGGILIDGVFGIRLGTNIYMSITLIGQIVFASGALFNSFGIMTLGRFIFGIGAEPLAVAQNNYAVAWFKGKELNMVFGLQLSFARVGSAVNFWVMEPLYEWVGQKYTGHECLGIVLFIATGTCILSMFCSLILGCIDKRAEQILRRDENTEKEVIKFKDVKEFRLNFWLITIVCVAYYVAIFPFIALGKVFFMKKFHMKAAAANRVNSIVYLISAFGSPILGLAVDKTGRNIFWVMLAITCTIGAHCILTFTMWDPYIGMSFMGIAYSLLASGLWPLVALIIPEHQLGTAYGICQSIQNLGLAIGTMLAGVIVDNCGYLWLELFFIGNLCGKFWCNLCSTVLLRAKEEIRFKLGSVAVSLLATGVILAVDTAQNGTLNMTPAERESHQQSVLAAEVLEREKLLSAGVATSVTPHDLLQPNSDFHIRNRYLSRIGAPLPSNYDINMKGLAFRALR